MLQNTRDLFTRYILILCLKDIHGNVLLLCYVPIFRLFLQVLNDEILVKFHENFHATYDMDSYDVMFFFNRYSNGRNEIYSQLLQFQLFRRLLQCDSSMRSTGRIGGWRPLGEGSACSHLLVSFHFAL